jgi:hypothetical protein
VWIAGVCARARRHAPRGACVFSCGGGCVLSARGRTPAPRLSCPSLRSMLVRAAHPFVGVCRVASCACGQASWRRETEREMTVCVCCALAPFLRACCMGAAACGAPCRWPAAGAAPRPNLHRTSRRGTGVCMQAATGLATCSAPWQVLKWQGWLETLWLTHTHTDMCPMRGPAVMPLRACTGAPGLQAAGLPRAEKASYLSVGRMPGLPGPGALPWPGPPVRPAATPNRASFCAAWGKWTCRRAGIDLAAPLAARRALPGTRGRRAAAGAAALGVPQGEAAAGFSRRRWGAGLVAWWCGFRSAVLYSCPCII